METGKICFIMEREIRKVYRWQNDMVMVFDQFGEQMGEYQGKYEEVREKILADANKFTEFFRGVWNMPNSLQKTNSF